jgi:hypothetical protein
MPHVIVTGGPGVGQDDSSWLSLPPGLPNRRRIRKGHHRGTSCSISRALPSGSSLIFGLIDVLGLLHEALPLTSIELETILASYPFDATVPGFRRRHSSGANPRQGERDSRIMPNSIPG